MSVAITACLSFKTSNVQGITQLQISEQMRSATAKTANDPTL